MATSSKLNILFLASWYPSKNHSTLGNFIQRHAEAVNQLHHVTVLYVTSYKSVSETTIEDKIINGVRTVIVYYKKGSIFKRARYIRATRKGIQHLKKNHEFNFDVVHLNVTYPGGIQALHIKRKYNIPYIITEHWTGYHSGKPMNPLEKQIHLLAGKQATYICPVSEHLGSAMKAFGINTPQIVVNNVVDTDLFKTSDKPKRKISRFIHVSSLVDDHKNISGMIRAMHCAWKINPELEFSIIGDGDIQPWIKMREQLDFSNLHIAGEQPLELIAESMISSDALILFSNYENMPCVISEAMSIGLPVISTDVGGIAEHVSTERGILIDKGNEVQLCEAIIQISKLQYNSDEIRAYALAQFSLLGVASKYNEVYQKVIA